MVQRLPNFARPSLATFLLLRSGCTQTTLLCVALGLLQDPSTSRHLRMAAGPSFLWGCYPGKLNETRRSELAVSRDHSAGALDSVHYDNLHCLYFCYLFSKAFRGDASSVGLLPSCRMPAAGFERGTSLKYEAQEPCLLEWLVRVL